MNPVGETPPGRPPLGAPALWFPTQPGSGPVAAQLPPAPPSAVADVLLRLAGTLLALAGGVVGAALAVLLVPLRVGSFGWPDGGVAAIRLPVAIVLAVAGNFFLVWFARHATGVRWAALLPGLGWFAVIVIALRTTTEGDRLLVPDDWVATLTLFGGTITLVIAMVLAVTPSRARTTYHR
jgi:hypothetical protein